MQTYRACMAIGMIIMAATSIHRARHPYEIGPPLPAGAARTWSFDGNPSDCYTVAEVAARERLTLLEVESLILNNRIIPRPVESYQEERTWMIPRDYRIVR